MTVETKSRRFLIYPRATERESAGIFVGRITKELGQRHYLHTSFPFHYTGRSILPWGHAFVMGFARHLPRLLADDRPSVHTMGKPYDPAMKQMLGIDGPADHDLIVRRGFSILTSDRKIAFISKYVRDFWYVQAKKHNVPWPDPSRIRIIHHGLDLNTFKPSPNRPVEPFVIGSAGAMRFDYRLKTLFQVSKQLKFDHRLLILGSMDDSCKCAMTEAMKDENLAARTTYVPWLESKELPRFYQSMHCFFHPVADEACGIVVTEALACGAPVVVPMFGGPAEFVMPDGGVAVHFEPYKYDDAFCERMADGVTRIRANYNAFTKGARHQAERHLSIEANVDTYLDMLNLPRRAS